MLLSGIRRLRIGWMLQLLLLLMVLAAVVRRGRGAATQHRKSWFRLDLLLVSSRISAAAVAVLLF